MNASSPLEPQKNFAKNENGISIGKADEDGIQIVETGTGNKVYIYYSEIDNSVQQMMKLKNEYSLNRVSTEPRIDLGVINASVVDGNRVYREFLGSDVWKQTVLRILKRDGFCCQECGCGVGLEVHHKVYRNGGGLVDDDGLVTLCHECHVRIGKKGRR